MFGDSWFSSVEATCQLWTRCHVRYAGVVKTNHARFPKKFIEEKMKDWPAGSHLVLEGHATLEDVHLIAIGYRYNSRKTIFFLCHADAGPTECTDFYEAKWKDDNQNTQVRRIPQPEIIGRYFKCSNLVDIHNQARQYELGLEKHWVTHSGWF